MLDRFLKKGRDHEAPGELPEVLIKPIGVVSNRIRSTEPRDWAQVTSRIVLRPELAPALLGLGDYSHIIVLFWLHAVPPGVRGSKLQLHPRDDPQNPLQGILATRSQIRPNPIGLTAPKLLGISGNVLQVRGLDAIDGTPVLDIKPYLPFYDAISDAKVPDWVMRYH